MDLLSIIRKLWRYKLAALPVVVLTMLGAAYVVAVKQPVYEADASFALLMPPAPPSADAIARDPKLGRINTDNPYTRFGDPSVLIEVLSSSMNSESVRRALVRAGADPRFMVAPSADVGYSRPIVQVTAMAWTAKDAVRTAKLANDATVRELDRMQANVDANYRIKAIPIVVPEQAQLQASGKLRMLVGVLVLGAVLLFIVISVADAISTLKAERTHGGDPVIATHQAEYGPARLQPVASNGGEARPPQGRPDRARASSWDS